MRILLAAGLYPPEIGGPATYATLMEHVLPDNGIDVTTLPFATVRAHPRLLRHLLYTWRLWKLSKHVDLIYALDPISVGLPARIVSAARRLPLVIRLGGDYAWEQGVQRFGMSLTLDEYTGNPKTAPWQVRLLARLQQWVVAASARVVVPSKYLASIVSTWAVDASRIVVICSAYDPIEPTFDRKTTRERFNLEDEVLLSAGRLTPWKGFDVLIEVLAQRRASGHNSTLVIAGDGPERVNLVALAKKAGVEHSVRFVGPISKSELGSLILASDVFLLNTSYEGLSHQLLEAMALGTPVITTPVGGNRELITSDSNGVLVSMNDHTAFNSATQRLLTDEPYRATIVANAQKRVRDFDNRSAAKEIVTLLTTVITPQYNT